MTDISINHEDTVNKELSVTLVKALSRETGKDYRDINLDRFVCFEGLNHIFKCFDEDSSKNTKITFEIEDIEVEIYNDKEIILKH